MTGMSRLALVVAVIAAYAALNAGPARASSEFGD